MDGAGNGQWNGSVFRGRIGHLRLVGGLVGWLIGCMWNVWQGRAGRGGGGGLTGYHRFFQAIFLYLMSGKFSFVL